MQKDLAISSITEYRGIILNGGFAKGNGEVAATAEVRLSTELAAGFVKLLTNKEGEKVN